MTTLAHVLTGAGNVPDVRESARFYKPELDLLRLFAFLLVFSRHVVTGIGIATHLTGSAVSQSAATGGASQWHLLQRIAQSLDFGVCLFFFLSSYLITSLLLIELDRKGDFDRMGFYVRRSARIWPLYFFFLGAMAIAGQQIGWLNITTSRLVMCAVFLGNLSVARFGWAGSPIDSLWSVSVEEQFYLVWPQIMRFGRRALHFVSIGGMVLSFGAVAVLGSLPDCHNTRLWCNSLVQGMFFCGGALLAQRHLYRRNELSKAARVTRFAVGLFCWAVASTVCSVVATDSPGALALVFGYALMLVGTACLISSVLDLDVSRVPAAFFYLGKISYGLYVYHFLCLELTTHLAAALFGELQGRIAVIALHGVSSVLALGLTIGVSALSYELLEKPFVLLKRRFTVVQSRPA